MDKITLNFEFSEYCRVCVEKSHELKSLQEEMENGITISEVVKMCTQFSLQEDESKPKQICQNCITMLNTAYEFYNLVKSSQRKFENLFSSQSLTNNIKNENFSEQSPNNLEVFDNNLTDTKDFTCSVNDLCQIDIETENIFVEESNVTLLCDESEESHSIKVETVNDKGKRNQLQKTVKKPKIVKIRRRSINNVIGNFECYKCKLGFPSLLKVQMHLEEHDTMTKCRICMKTVNRCEYVQHLCIGKEIDCQYCTKSFTTTITLIKHINKNHKKHKNYKCYNCARAFHTKLLLEIHKPSHDAEELRFICDICGNRFRTRYQIKEHMDISHTDKRCNLFDKFYFVQHFI